MALHDQKWIELNDIREVKYNAQAWIPIYGFKYGEKKLEFPDYGYCEEFQEFRSAVIFNKYKSSAEKISDWEFWNKDDVTPHYSKESGYQETHKFCDENGESIGFRMVVSQYLARNVPYRVYLYQDFVIAYNLIPTKGSWIRPRNDYETVVKYIPGKNREVERIEIRASYLKDYLAARNASLRIYSYSHRRLVQSDKPDYDWEDKKVISNQVNDRCKVYVEHVNKHGDKPFTGSIIVKTWRNDVNFREEIPDFSKKSDSGIASESTTTVDHFPADRYYSYGRMWRGEWVFPADTSTQIGFAEPDEDLFVLTENTSDKVNLKSLKSEEVRKYLWFNPKIISLLSDNRNGVIRWSGRNLGSFSYSLDTEVVFGVNSVGLVTVYAYDIAKLSLWERRIWVSQNCAPEGGAGKELLEFQQECRQPRTSAPETNLVRSIDHIDRLFSQKFKSTLFLEQFQMSDIIEKVHRFRAVDEDGLLKLARDLFKYVIEWINGENLNKVLKEKLKPNQTLKMLQQFSQEHNSDRDAHKTLSPLFGISDLRNYESHPPSSLYDIEGYYKIIGIDRSQPMIYQGSEMIERIADTFAKLSRFSKAT